MIVVLLPTELARRLVARLGKKVLFEFEATPQQFFKHLRR